MVGIYKITSPSGKVYIGQSWNVKQRWATYKSKTGPREQPALKRSIIKYGAINHVFELVHELPPDTNQQIMNEYENLYIDQYRDCGFCLLNLSRGGSNGKICETTRIKMSESAKKHGTYWNKFRKMSDSHKAILKKVNTGRKKSEEEKRKISIARTLQPNRGGIKNKGIIRTKENKLKISNTLKSRTDNKGEFNNMAKLTNEIVIEIRSKYIPRICPSRKLAKEYGISKTNILDIINRKIWKNI